MRKLCILLCIVLFAIQCGQKQDAVEVISEGGIEVVLNHIAPYQIEGESSRLDLVHEFSLSLGDEKLAEIGVVDIYGFEITSKGDIFILGPPARSDNHVFKFDMSGNFVKAFGPKGQGPGELQYPTYLKINSKDELPVLDIFGSKLVLFNQNGEVISERKLDVKLNGRSGVVYPLDSGRYVIVRVEPDPSGEFGNQILSLVDSNFDEIRELDRFRNYYPQQASKYKLPQDIFWWTISARGDIYVGNTERGYEITRYDSSGKPTKIVRKEFIQVPVPEEIKEKALGPIPEDHPMRKTLYFADHMPPFEFFFLDDKERLYVMTSEKEGSRSICDIFSDEGVFIGRRALNASFNRFNKYGTQVLVRNDTFIYVQVNEAGYKELVRCKLNWE
jgi:hypothetical protein